MKPLFCAIVAVGSLPVAITAFAQSSFAPANAPDTNLTAAVPCREQRFACKPPHRVSGDILCRRCHSALAANCGHSPFGDCQECPNVFIRAIPETPSRIDLEQKGRS
jgi:hypothetical protein